MSLVKESSFDIEITCIPEDTEFDSTTAVIDFHCQEYPLVEIDTLDDSLEEQQTQLKRKREINSEMSQKRVCTQDIISLVDDSNDELFESPSREDALDCTDDRSVCTPENERQSQVQDSEILVIATPKHCTDFVLFTESTPIETKCCDIYSWPECSIIQKLFARTMYLTELVGKRLNDAISVGIPEHKDSIKCILSKIAKKYEKPRARLCRICCPKQIAAMAMHLVQDTIANTAGIFHYNLRSISLTTEQANKLKDFLCKVRCQGQVSAFIESQNYIHSNEKPFEEQLIAFPLYKDHQYPIIKVVKGSLNMQITQAVVYSLSTTEFAMSNSREEFQGGYQQIFEAGEVVSIPPGQLSSKGVKRIIRVAFPQPSEDSLTKSMYNIFLEASRYSIESITIPLIQTNGPFESDAAIVLVRSILFYLREHCKNTSLKFIHLIGENDQECGHWRRSLLEMSWRSKQCGETKQTPLWFFQEEGDWIACNEVYTAQLTSAYESWLVSCLTDQQNDVIIESIEGRFKIHFSDNNHFWTNMFTNEKQNLKLVNGSIDSEDSINIMFPIRIYGRSTGEFNPQSSLFVTGFDKDAVEAVLEEAKSISQIELFTENLDYPQIFNVDFEVMKHISMSELSNIPESRDAYCSFLEGKGLAITGKMETVRAIKHQLLNLIFLRVNQYIQSLESALISWTPHEEILMDVDWSFEWVIVSSFVKRTMNDAQIVKIQRIQNKRVWRNFIRFCNDLESERGTANRMKLLHGSRGTPPNIICQEGFDFRHSRAGMWGRGSYFAEKSDYSYNYAHILPNGQKQIFIVDVACGNVQETNPNQSIIKPKEGCDSVSGVTCGCKVHIVYNNAQTYPLYLITLL